MLVRSAGFVVLLCCVTPLIGCNSQDEAVPTSTSANDPPVASAPAEPLPREGQKQLGPVCYVPPEGWEERPSKTAEGLTYFVPDRDEWKKIGFRPNMGIRVRTHPGGTPDQYEKFLRNMFSQSVAKLDHDAKTELREAGKLVGKKFALTGKGGFSLTREKIDGCEVFVSVFDGVYQLPSGRLATRTRGVQLMDKTKLYSISFTYPLSAVEEMEAAWGAFRAELNIDAAGLGQ